MASGNKIKNQSGTSASIWAWLLRAADYCTTFAPKGQRKFISKIQNRRGIFSLTWSLLKKAHFEHFLCFGEHFGKSIGNKSTYLGVAADGCWLPRYILMQEAIGNKCTYLGWLLRTADYCTIFSCRKLSGTSARIWLWLLRAADYCAIFPCSKLLGTSASIWGWLLRPADYSSDAGSY